MSADQGGVICLACQNSRFIVVLKCAGSPCNFERRSTVDDSYEFSRAAVCVAVQIAIHGA